MWMWRFTHLVMLMALLFTVWRGAFESTSLVDAAMWIFLSAFLIFVNALMAAVGMGDEVIQEQLGDDPSEEEEEDDEEEDEEEDESDSWKAGR